MKKILLTITLILLSVKGYAQNDTLRKPVECGTQRIADEMEKDKNYQKIIEDFISASEKDMMFGNGLIKTIGKQNSDEDILKIGLEGYGWKKDNIRILKGLDDKDFRYLLFSHQKTGQKEYQIIGMYNKTGFSFRCYDPFYYKNYYHQELNGVWKMSEGFSPKRNQEIRLEKTNVELDYGYALEIKEDYSFIMYDRCDCPSSKSIEGRYGFDAEGKISFYCNDFHYSVKKRKRKPFVSGPFQFTIENGVLTLKK